MMRSILSDYLRLMRFPGAFAAALTPVVGALSVGVSSLPVIGPLFLIGFFSKIYGFILNDYIDIDLDALSTDLSQRSLVKGTISKNRALIILTVCFIAAYSAIFLFFYSNNVFFFIALFCIIIADILGIVYNIYGKQILGSDFFIALAESMLFLFGALIVLENKTFGLFQWILFLYIFTLVFYMNAVIGGLKDADHDYLRSAKTIALAIGVRVTPEKNVFIPWSFRIFSIGLQAFSAGLLFAPFVWHEIRYELWQILLLLIILIVAFATSYRMLMIKQFDRKRLRKNISGQLFLWSAAVPLLLASIIGWLAAAILVSAPVLWYFAFSLLIGETLFQPQL